MLAALLAVAYLLHPVLGWTNYSEGFHPDAFEIPLVLLAVWFLIRHRWVGYGICIVALLLVQEDVALPIFPLASMSLFAMIDGWGGSPVPSPPRTSSQPSG